MALDDDDKAFIADQIKSALVEHAKLAAAETVKIVKDQVKPLGERLDAAEEAAKARDDVDDVDDDKGADTDAGTSGKPDPKVARLEAKLQAMEKQAREAEERRQAAEEKAKSDRLIGAARDALLAAGVPSDRARFALAALKDEGILAFDDDGVPGLKFQRQGYSEVVPAEAGAAEWLKSDAGKLFLPPSDAQGSGQRGGRRPPSGTGQPIDAETLSRNLFRAVAGG